MSERLMMGMDERRPGRWTGALSSRTEMANLRGNVPRESQHNMRGIGDMRRMSGCSHGRRSLSVMSCSDWRPLPMFTKLSPSVEARALGHI
jgi:hypothetical protein